MPIIRIPISDTISSVVRPVITSITSELSDKMGFDPNTPIFYADELGQAKQHNSGITRNDDYGSKTGNDNLIIVNVDEVFDDTTMDTPVMATEYMPVFRDDQLKVLGRPIYIPHILNFNYSYRCRDRHEAEMWQNKIRSKMSYWGDLNHHLLTYHWLLPEIFLLILENIHELRENVAGYGDSFAKYLKDHASIRLTRLSNFKGSRTRLAIAEKQVRVFGSYDFSVGPEKGQREGDNSAWLSNFSYRVHYTKPTEFWFRYPLMVHQQLLPEPFIPSAEDKTYEHGLGRERHFSLSGIHMELFSAQDMARKREIREGIQVPEFDEWIPEDTLDGTYRIFDVLIALDKQEPDKLINLLEVPGSFFSDELKAFMKEEAKYMNTPGKSIFICSLYNQDHRLRENLYHVDEELNVCNDKHFTLRNVYHVRLSIYKDLSLLDEDARRRLAKYPNLLKDLLKFCGVDWDRLIRHLLSLHTYYYEVEYPNVKRYQVGHHTRIPEDKSEFTAFDKWKVIPPYIMWEICKFLSKYPVEDLVVNSVQSLWIEARDKDLL